MHLTASGHTDGGPRPSNQDAHQIDLALGLIVVADGMGGHNAGEVASRMAVDAVVEFVRATQESPNLTWPFPYDPERPGPVNRLAVALQVANRAVYDAGHMDPKHAGMGTTIVAALIDRDRIVIGHVGDSRAYRLRDGQLEQITEDHTWLNAMSGCAVEEGVSNHPMRHVLTCSIGMREDLSPSIAEERLVAGEHWLFCTDGVHGSLDKGALATALRASTPDDSAQQVVASALAAPTSDNATAIVLFVD